MADQHILAYHRIAFPSFTDLLLVPQAAFTDQLTFPSFADQLLVPPFTDQITRPPGGIYASSQLAKATPMGWCFRCLETSELSHAVRGERRSPKPDDGAGDGDKPS